MPVIILVVCFLLSFFSTGIFFSSLKNKKELLLINTIIFSVAVVIITELLSYSNKLDFLSLLTSWLVYGIINLLYLYTKKDRLGPFIESLIDVKKTFARLNKIQLALAGCILCILLLIFIQGVVYPPNNFDSMTYHLSRILSWISQRSVHYYPTDITRQLYQPPFAEYLIMHVNLLTGTDYFANSVQFFYLLFTVITIILFIEKLGLGQEYKIAGILLICTIPEVILEASSTQNDIIVSFFVIAAFYFTVKIIEECKIIYFILLGLSIALAVLTKGIAYIYLAPIVLLAVVGTIINFGRTLKYNYLWFSLTAVALFVLTNAGYYSRNYNLSGNFLGVDRQESKEYSNQKMNVGYLLSTCIKNAGLHLCFMYTDAVSNVSEKAINGIHELIKVNVNDRAVTYRHNIFSTKSNTTNEDCAPNMLHFIITLAAFIVLAVKMRQQKSRYVNWIAAIITIQIILFCSYLKWQPWHSRLHIPFFLLSVPLVCYVMSISLSFKKAFYILSPLILIYAFLVVFHNHLRPYTSSIKSTRNNKYFMGKPEAYKEYNDISSEIKQLNCKNVGLKIGIDDWVYPLFRDFYRQPVNPVYIQPDNLSNKLSATRVNVDCIVTTLIKKPYIDFNGRRFYNQFKNNKILYFYK